MMENKVLLLIIINEFDHYELRESLPGYKTWLYLFLSLPYRSTVIICLPEGYVCSGRPPVIFALGPSGRLTQYPSNPLWTV